MKGLKSFAALFAVIVLFTLSVFAYSSPPVSQEDEEIIKVQSCEQSEGDESAVEAPEVQYDYAAVIPDTKRNIGFRVTRQFTPAIIRRNQVKPPNYRSQDRQQPDLPPNRNARQGS